MGPPRFYERLKAHLATYYDSLLARRWFKTAIVGWFVIVALAGLAYALVAAAQLDRLDFWEAGQLISSLAAGALVVIGVLRWRRSRLSAYRWFERALLVTIFVYEFFAFYQNQLAAVFGLVVVLITYAGIRLMIREEEARVESSRLGADAPAGRLQAQP